MAHRHAAIASSFVVSLFVDGREEVVEARSGTERALPIDELHGLDGICSSSAATTTAAP